MTPDILFFQAAATAIPTLAIAVVVSGRVFDHDAAERFDEEKRSSQAHKAPTRRNELWASSAAISYFVIATLGERAALVALYDNEPTRGRAMVVTFALIYSVVALILKILDFFMTKNPRDVKFVRIIGLAIGVGLVLVLSWPI